MTIRKLTHKAFLTKLAFWLVTISTLLISTYSLFPSELFRIHDYTQGARVIEMFRGFRDGQVPVRWSSNFGFGYGMPTFLFYGPFPYMIGAAVYWLTQDLVFSLKVLWAIPSIFSFIGMYRLTKKHFGQWGALIAAVSFTLAPYRAVDLYVRGAIGEIWGIAFFPWLLIAVDEWFERPKTIDLKLTLLTGLLLITHNLMAMFFLPVVLFYGMLKWIFAEKRKMKDVVLFGLQLLIGFGTSAFFILPALAEKGFTQFEQRILSGYFSYEQHFVYIRQFFKENWKYGGSVWGPEDDISFFLGYGQYLAIAIFILVILYWVYRKLSNGKVSISNVATEFIRHHLAVLPLLILAAVFFPVSLFLATQKSEIIWKLSSMLQTAQFPWRFLSLTVFCLAILNGAIFRFTLIKPVKVILFAVLFISLLTPAIKYFKPDNFLDTANAFYYTDAHKIRAEMSGTWPDFLPTHFNADIEPTDERFQLAQGGNPKDVEVLIDRSHQLLLQTHFTAPTQLILNIADFPGWVAFINGEETSISQTQDGVIQILVPPGEQLISAEFERTPVRLIADIITVVSVSIIIGSQLIIPKKYTV